MSSTPTPILRIKGLWEFTLWSLLSEYGTSKDGALSFISVEYFPVLFQNNPFKSPLLLRISLSSEVQICTSSDALHLFR